MVVGFVAYTYLGGLKPVEYAVHGQEIYEILGMEYSGKNNSMDLMTTFEITRELANNEYPDGTFVIVSNEKLYDAETNTVGYFVGISFKEAPTAIPEGYTLRQYSSVNIVRARIESHNMVMPKPDKIRKRAIELARSNGFHLSEISIEKYFEEGIIEVDFLSKD